MNGGKASSVWALVLNPIGGSAFVQKISKNWRAGRRTGQANVAVFSNVCLNRNALALA